MNVLQSWQDADTAYLAAAPDLGVRLLVMACASHGVNFAQLRVSIAGSKVAAGQSGVEKQMEGSEGKSCITRIQ